MKMALSAAEKQRRYRQKRDADPERRQKWLKYQKQKYNQDVTQGKRKLVKDMTSREHRQEKRKWKQRKSESRRQQPQPQETAPSTPQARQGGPSTSPGPSYARQRIENRRRRKAEQAQREMASLQNIVQQQKKKIKMYQKRFHRLEPKSKGTPRSKARTLLGKMRKDTMSKKTVRKTLVFHYSLIDQIKHNHKNHKASAKHLVAGEILRKYRFKNEASKLIGCSPYNYKKKKGSLSSRLRASVQKFFEREDVSRMLAGKRNTITRRKIKKQRRVLCDFLCNLYLKYRAETLENLSFVTFWRLKPFWVTYAKKSDRDTCLCKTCENTQYMAESLYKLNVIETARIQVLTRQLACSVDNKKCMYRECQDCASRTVQGTLADTTRDVSWTQWETVQEERTFKNGEKKMVKRVLNSLKTGTVGVLWDKFHAQMSKYCQHSYNIANQYKHYRHLRENMKQNECLVHVDFAENYIGKMHKEIQSMHFGASQIQMTLHTGCYFIGEKEHPVSFCGVSDSLQHDPSAVWAYLRKVLKDIRSDHPAVDTVHFFSDGPTTQYRQKINFYLLSTEIYKMGFLGATWNFHEAGHGKGIPDGVGAAVKRAADSRVLHGANILDSKTLVEEVTHAGTSVKLYIVTDRDINDVEKELENITLKTVPGTMKLHQLIVVAPQMVKYRDTSCTCVETTCPDHELRDCSLAPGGFGCTPGSSKRTPEDVNKTEKTHTTTKRPKPQENDSSKTVVHTTEQEFADHLTVLQNCQTFEELKFECGQFNVQDINIKPNQRSIQQDNLSIDPQARKLYPPDVPGPRCTPVKVRADGDCLPGTGSLLAFGADDHPAEMRVRIVHELALHDKYYLNEDNLTRGLTISEKHKAKAKNAFCMFSDEYVAGTKVTDETIRTVYEKEVLQITRPRTYMGIWQVCALSSVLQSPIFSAYPRRGNPSVRADLHRLILPRVDNSCTPTTGCEGSQAALVIMWTSTRCDMVDCNWIPNHFVPAVPDTVNTADSGRLAGNVSDQIIDVPPPEECLGQWVLVQYDGKPYPGVVEDVDGTDLYVKCMNSVGKELSNTFFWPKTYTDLCWYAHDNILAVIPNPLLAGGTSYSHHFAVDERIWDTVVTKVKG